MRRGGDRVAGSSNGGSGVNTERERDEGVVWVRVYEKRKDRERRRSYGCWRRTDDGDLPESDDGGDNDTAEREWLCVHACVSV